MKPIRVVIFPKQEKKLKGTKRKFLKLNKQEWGEA